MRVCTCHGSHLVLLLLLNFLLASWSNAEPGGDIDIDPSKPVLTCDAILEFAFPDLCEMEVTQSSVEVRGLKMVYWLYRNKAVKSSKTPIVMIHGGPAFGHNYILPMKQQACRGRDVVFYDQVGAGLSDKPNLTDAPWLLTIDYYTEEVRAIVQEMGWSRFHIFGSSWGTIVGQAYGFKQDKRVESIVLSGPLSDGPSYIEAQWDEYQGNLGSLPFHVQAVLRKLGKEAAWTSPLYLAEDNILTFFFTTRTTPLASCFADAAPTSNISKEIYVKMQGPSEFSVGGVLAATNFTPRLKEIKVPVLLTHGKYDTMRPPVIDAMASMLPKVWRALLPRSGHCSMIDDPKLMNDVVGDFYNSVEVDGGESFKIPDEAVDPGKVPLGPLEAPKPSDLGLAEAPLSLAAVAGALPWPQLGLTLFLGMVLGAGLSAIALRSSKLHGVSLNEPLGA
mmetsp:Transcript_93919/g.205644  ORF Transcript_93919/g.205644 Transcript_93919/m.205644 type:complete len:448 (+) Transcript_93919:183-1526(+)|eukprot:CAMPEP_0206430716 /NCGR_PEP_ID=MMETSP0324_2-20121206/6970_1 /ASSEMBLY_ACC=CAM_ASM_000836 /TAXON_ID=2866 /ORGANISM="Crypthecodinium cohnii, Strain Seligo" /LENGTH=447 /DNA_ID=CAMNT_0053896577 /DNA_START=86 /DNA_END=1429 /DNA_ORIENTATION=-